MPIAAAAVAGGRLQVDTLRSALEAAADQQNTSKQVMSYAVAG